MAVKRFSDDSSIKNTYRLSRGATSAAIPNTPTIGVATTVNDSSATVAYTAAILGATASSFTATSTPGSLTGTGSSPITVSGLTASTSYTFTVRATNSNGSSSESSASNSITTDSVPNSYQSIQTVTVTSSSQSTISFTSIPSTYTHLQIRCITRSVNTPSQQDSFYMTFNSDNGSNYSDHYLRGSGSAMSVGYRINAGNILVGYQPDNGYTSGIFGTFIIDILDYANTNKNKTTRTLGGFDSNNTGSEVGTLALTGGQWRSTAAISSIQLVAGGGRNTAQYSTFALYGIKGS